MQYIIKNIDDSKRVAENLVKSLNIGSIIAFSGDLGAGKTFICREIIRLCCGADVSVPSPTFNILQTYSAPKFTIYHYDLYRLLSPDELCEIGLEEALNEGACLVEWPEIANDALKHYSVTKVHLEILDDSTRKCTVHITPSPTLR